MSSQPDNPLPANKTLWSYWHQGIDDAPELVRECWESWRRCNPSYQLVCLDKHTLPNFVDLFQIIDVERKDITVQKISVLARLQLLQKFGGVWTDATVFCTRPLDQWLPEYYTSGFFVFRNPHPDRYLSNWLIISEHDNVILQDLTRELFRFYTRNRFTNQNTRLGKYLIRKLERRLDNPKSTLFWHSFLARRILRIYPYFIFHYTFNKVILQNKECRELWNSATAYDAAGPMLILRSFFKNRSVDEIKDFVRSGGAPVHKLDWRSDKNHPYWAQVLPFLYSFNQLPRS